MLTQLETAKMTWKTEQDQVIQAFAETDPDAVVILPAAISEQDASTTADAEEATMLAVRMCRDQISHSKYFAHVWPRWSNARSVMEVPRLVRMNNIQAVDFDMCRFRHPDKGSMIMIMKPQQVVQKAKRRCSSRQRHSARKRT